PSPSTAATQPPPGALEYALSRRPSPDELGLRRARGESVMLQAAVFDPLTEPLPDFARGRTVTGSERMFLVQFRHDLSAAERRSLEGIGVSFVDFVPNHAYLVQASPAAFAALRGRSLVRWVDAFRGGYKLAPILRSESWA